MSVFIYFFLGYEMPDLFLFVPYDGYIFGCMYVCVCVPFHQKLQNNEWMAFRRQIHDVHLNEKRNLFSKQWKKLSFLWRFCQKNVPEIENNQKIINIIIFFLLFIFLNGNLILISLFSIVIGLEFSCLAVRAMRGSSKKICF